MSKEKNLSIDHLSKLSDERSKNVC